MQTGFTELTDSQWQFMEKIIGDKRKRFRPLREIVNAILFINRTGCQWRCLDSRYPPWQTVFYHFSRFQTLGIWEQLLDELVVNERLAMGRKASPSLLAIDSQSVKTVQFVSVAIGVDGGKSVNGRKRTILVDTQGLPLAVKVTAANVSDNEAGLSALETLKGKVPLLKKITADAGYKVAFAAGAKALGWPVEIAQKPESQKGFIPQKNRWQVERSFGWLNFRRRLFREVEKTVESAEAMLQIAFISFIINRL